MFGSIFVCFQRFMSVRPPPRSETWVDDPNAGTSTFDLFTVALHEFGHTLGLGHSNFTNAVMFGSYSGAKRTLHVDDIAGIEQIYGAVPVPASVWLFGSALGLLVWIRRKAS